MDSDFKRAVKLMWGNKRTRAAFGCGFGVGVSESGLIYLGILVLDLMPIVASFFGKSFSDKTLMTFVALAACLCGTAINFHGQRMFAQYGRLGKYFGSLPLAKYVMTKGYLFTTWILWGCGFLITAVLYGSSVVIGAAPVEGFPILLFLYGMSFFLDGVGCALRHKNNPEGDVFYSTGTMITMIWLISVVRDMDSLAEDGMSLKSAGIWFVAFMVVGNFLLCFFSKKRYRERTTVALIVLPEEE